MQDLKVHNSRFITYQDLVLTVDVLGGVDLQQIERLVSTLRITYQDYPPMRTTLDLYSDPQVDKLIRTLCDKYELPLLEASKSVHALIRALEGYKLDRLKYPKLDREPVFELSEEEAIAAKKYLSAKDLTTRLQSDLEQLGILGEADNALILFLAMASHRFSHPFSVLCLAKSGIGKSYLLQKLSECLPSGWFSLHTQISENALYYFDSHQLDGKVLFIEDLEWTQKMLLPLSTLQTQGRLVKTRATKDKDGMLHSTTFEVVAKLCLIACAYSEKNFDQLSLPFLFLHLNHSPAQDRQVMEYQKRLRAGLIDTRQITATQRRLKCVLASLAPVGVINPFAPLIQLPEDIPHPRKTLLLLLNFMDIVTFFFQHQRSQTTNPDTGEVFVQTHPDDIDLTFSLLQNCLLRRADELSTTARGFYNWLTKFLAEVKTDQFSALDIRKACAEQGRSAKRIHPRTLNRYLKELTQFHYLQVIGGNKHRGGYIYKLTQLCERSPLQGSIADSLQQTLKQVKDQFSKSVGQNPVSKSATRTTAAKTSRTTHKKST